MPKVSILMPTRNNAPYLHQAIESALNQSFVDFELIVVDDGSADNSQDIISDFHSREFRIVSVRHEHSLGLVACLNEAIDKSRGEYLARLDGDDYWTDKSKLSQQIGFLQRHPDCALVGTWAQAIDKKDQALFQIKYPADDLNIRKEFLLHNCFVHSSILVKKSAIISAGGYYERERFVEDYGLWLRIAEKNSVANLPNIMVGYRVLSSGVTRANNLKQIQAAARLAKKFSRSFPNYNMAKWKWPAQYLVTALGLGGILQRWKN